MEAGVWRRPGRAEVAGGVAGPGKLSENEAARPAADLLRGSGARVPSADRDATEPRAHSPRRSPGRGFVSALATPTSFSAKPTNPCRVPTEACWPRPREAPPAARPEAGGKGGGLERTPGGKGRRMRRSWGRCQRGRELLRRKLQAAELLQNAPPGGVKTREGGASGEQ